MRIVELSNHPGAMLREEHERLAGYRRHMAPRVRQLIAAHAGNADVAVLRDRRAVRRYLAEVTALVSTARVPSAGGERG